MLDPLRTKASPRSLLSTNSTEESVVHFNDGSVPGQDELLQYMQPVVLQTCMSCIQIGISYALMRKSRLLPLVNGLMLPLEEELNDDANHKVAWRYHKAVGVVVKDV